MNIRKLLTRLVYVINDKFEVNYTAFLRFMIDCFFQTLQCFCNCIFIFPCFF